MYIHLQDDYISTLKYKWTHAVSTATVFQPLQLCVYLGAPIWNLLYDGLFQDHYIRSAMVYQITSLAIVYSTVYSGTNEKTH